MQLHGALHCRPQALTPERGTYAAAVIIWINGPFGAGKTTVTTRLLEGDASLVMFDTENVGSMLRAALQRRIPVADFQDWTSWRRLVVATLSEISAELGSDVVVPQTVVIEPYWREITTGLSERHVPLRAFTLDVASDELKRRILHDHADPEAAGWRIERRSDFEAALPWLRNTTRVIDTTAMTPHEVAQTIIRDVTGSTSKELIP